MTNDELGEIILRQIYGPALGGAWHTTAELACKTTGCTDFGQLEDTLVTMINSGLIRVFKWQVMPNGQVLETYIPASEIEAEIFDEAGFSIEPLPAAEAVLEKLASSRAAQA